MPPLVSVCIGAYNRERYIRETLDSVFAQTYPNLEIIVVDDASTDRTVELIRSYGNRVKLIQRETNSGMCPVTRNQAARAATGDYIAFLDSDDRWYPAKIERQVAFMEQHPDVPLCHTYCDLMDEESRVVGIRHEGALPPTGNYFIPLLKHCWITISSVLVRRGIFDLVGGYFTEDRRYGVWGEEYEFFLRVARKYSVGLVPDVLASYRRGAQGVSGGDWKRLPEAVSAHRLVLRRPDLWEGVVARSVVVDAIVQNCLTNSEYWRREGYSGRALYFAGLALVEKPCRGAAWKEALKSIGRVFLPVRRQRAS